MRVRLQCLTVLLLAGVTAVAYGQSPPVVPAAPAAAAKSVEQPMRTAQIVVDSDDSAATSPAALDTVKPVSLEAKTSDVKTAPAATLAPLQTSLQPSSFDQVVDRLTASEQQFLENVRKYTPLLETYIQDLKPDPDLGQVPRDDHYFFGRLELTASGAASHSFLPKKGFFSAMLDKLTSFYDLQYLPLGFAQMIVPDNQGLNRQNYEFKFVSREFLGEVRCLVIDVKPLRPGDHGRFLGRIWVDDQGYNIVRFNGTYTRAALGKTHLHFDSWRLNVQPNLWLPAYIYTEESDLKSGLGFAHTKFKGQTRLWAYEKHIVNSQGEFTEVLVDAPEVKDESDNARRDLSPLEAQRAWERQAEDNVLQKLTQAGLLAPAGEADKVLETVVNNLMITNHLDIQPAVRCRVLLTAPLESFSVGHTIVISRGLLDVLPDEATLAMVLSHELAHIALGHKVDTRFAFTDRMLFTDEQTYKRFHFAARSVEEQKADQKAVELLGNSPYKDQLASSGLFLKALELHGHDLPNLLRSHLGNAMERDNHVRMAQLLSNSPALEQRKPEQLPALPLGARIKVDPFTDRVELLKNKAVPLFSASEKMSFEVAPVFPYLTRYEITPAALAASAK